MIGRAFVLLLISGEAYSLKAGVSPIQKVIQLLQDMTAKGKQEKQDEEVNFAAFAQWCKGTAADKESAIEAGNAMIEQLQAEIQKAESDAAVLASEIAKLESDIGGWESDMKEATAIRQTEEKDFQATHADYSESVDALGRAIHTLKKNSANTAQGQALLQEVASLARVPASARKTIHSFLQLKQDPLSVSAPQAAAYEFQSGGVIDMLENLLDKFSDERNGAEKDEMNAKHGFDVMMLDLKNSVSAATDEADAKAKTKAQREEDAAQGKGDLATTTSTRDEDVKYLAETKSECEQKSSDFAARQQLRAEELEAVAKAIEIMKSGSVSGAGEKHLSLLQTRSLMLRGTNTQKGVNVRVADFLRTRAEKLGSKALAMLATQVSADPFGKVKKMIDGMITRLLEEANEEADHKGWCDKEMGMNLQTRNLKAEEVNALHAQVDKLSSQITTLGNEIADLTDAIAEINASVSEATSIRLKESAKNKATIEDAQDAQTAVAQATTVLKTFYAKAGEATALVQGAADDAPETFNEPYRGLGGMSGGVVGMLEVIESDFARLEAETKSSEATAQKEHERFLAESSKDKAVKTADMEHKKKAKVQKESDLNDAQKDLSGTTRELDASLEYYERLKPSCVDAGVSYEERVSRREAEIQSLQEALKILSDV